MAKERVERDEEDLVRLYLTDIGQYPLLTKDDEVRLAQQIESGNAARERARSPAARSSRPPRSASCAARRRRGRRRPAHVRAVEPAARRVDRQEVPGVGPAAARPDPGGQPRPDARGREVRLAQGLQVLDVRHVVDPPGDHPRHRQHRPHDPPARSTPATRSPACRRRVRAWSSSSAARRRSAELSAEVEMPEDKVTEALRFAAEPLSLSEPLREDGDAELGDIVEDRSAESPFEVAATALLPGRDREAAGPARRARAPDPRAALRARPRRAAHARGGRRVLQPHPGAHPPDRGPGDVEAASPVRRHRRPRPAGRLEPPQVPGRPKARLKEPGLVVSSDAVASSGYATTVGEAAVVAFHILSGRRRCTR